MIYAYDDWKLVEKKLEKIIWHMDPFLITEKIISKDIGRLVSYQNKPNGSFFRQT